MSNRNDDNDHIVDRDNNNALSLPIGIMVLDFLIALYSSIEKCDAAAAAVAFTTASRGLAIVVLPTLLCHFLVCKLEDERELIRRHHQQECLERSHVLELGAAWRNHLSEWAPLMTSMID